MELKVKYEKIEKYLYSMSCEIKCHVNVRGRVKVKNIENIGRYIVSFNIDIIYILEFIYIYQLYFNDKSITVYGIKLHKICRGIRILSKTSEL